MSTSTNKSVFTAAFEKATSVDYNPAWANNTGYFDGAATGDNAPWLIEGESFSFTDNKGRKGLILPTGKVGENIVIFERFSPTSDIYLLVRNSPRRYDVSFNAKHGHELDTGAITSVDLNAIFKAHKITV